MKTGETDADAGRQVFARAAAVLRTLEAHPGGLSVAEITRQSGLPRTTVARLITSMQAEDFVSVRSGRVRLGSALLRLATAANLDAASLVRPALEALALETRETVHLWIERENGVELLDELISDREVRVVSPPGARLPLSTSAPGKVFLSGLLNEEVEARLARAAEQHAQPSLTDMRALLSQLAAVRRQGIAYDLEEHAADVCAVAKRVRLKLIDHYAVAVAAPARRFEQSRETLEAALDKCVATIEAAR